MSYTKEQAVEVLTDLQEWTRYMYSDPSAIKQISERISNCQGQKFTLNFEGDGSYVLKYIGDSLAGMEARVIPFIVPTPSTEGYLNSFAWQGNVIYPEGISEEQRELIKTSTVFVGSFFTRMVAFNCFARLMPESLDDIASTLADTQTVK